jgi:hypothetical protein
MYKCESYNYILFYLSNLFIKNRRNMWGLNVCDVESLSIVSVVDVCFIYYQTLNNLSLNMRRNSVSIIFKNRHSLTALQNWHFSIRKVKAKQTNKLVLIINWQSFLLHNHMQMILYKVFLKLRACSKYLNIELLCANIFETSWIYVSSRIYRVLSIVLCKLFRNTLY